MLIIRLGRRIPPCETRPRVETTSFILAVILLLVVYFGCL